MKTLLASLLASLFALSALSAHAAPLPAGSAAIDSDSASLPANEDKDKEKDKDGGKKAD